MSEIVFGLLYTEDYTKEEWDKIEAMQQKVLQEKGALQKDKDKYSEVGPPISDDSIDSDVSDEYKIIYSCERCGNKTYPTSIEEEAEKRNVSRGAIIIIKKKLTGEETRRLVLCYQCMSKTKPESLCNADEKPLMSFIGPDDLYSDDSHR